ITIEGDQPALRPKTREHCPAVTAAPEGAVDVDAVGTDRERVDRLGEQDAHMGTMQAHSARLSNPGGRPVLTSSSIACCCFSQRSSDHSSKCVPWPTS